MKHDAEARGADCMLVKRWDLRVLRLVNLEVTERNTFILNMNRRLREATSNYIDAAPEKRQIFGIIQAALLDNTYVLSFGHGRPHNLDGAPFAHILQFLGFKSKREWGTGRGVYEVSAETVMERAKSSLPFLFYVWRTEGTF
jgi:hypothetical protein